MPLARTGPRPRSSRPLALLPGRMGAGRARDARRGPHRGGGGRRAAAAGDRRLAGRALLPAMPNLHSHAFQRAMAGMTGRRGEGEDSFWTWRELMYRFLSC